MRAIRWRTAALLLCVAACKGGACEKRDSGQGIYEAIPRGPFHLDEALTQEPPEPPQASASAPTIVLAVLDTVRADHTSLCGYARQTTPYLEQLAKRGAVHTCRAYSPGDWSLPSHASYYTGVSVARHGAHYARGEEDDKAKRVRSLYVYPLRGDIPTLAEQMQERGYQTVLVSDNYSWVKRAYSAGFR